jgi:uncharacterized integral membrane protein
MIGLIRWIAGLFMTAVVVLFALGNRAPVEIAWNPLSERISLPLFLPILIALAAGFLAGGFSVWLNGAQARAEQRRQRKLIRELEKQVDDTAAKAATASVPVPATGNATRKSA